MVSEPLLPLYPPFCTLSEATMPTAAGKSLLHWAMHPQSHPTHEHIGEETY